MSRMSATSPLPRIEDPDRKRAPANTLPSGLITVWNSPSSVSTTRPALRLPLTLAIINGFQVGVGKSVFVIPMDMVEECIEYRDAPGCDYVDLRGQPLPFVRLRERFALHGPAARRQSIVVVRYGSSRAGLVVDSLLGEFQTVIKPLGKVFSGARFLSGSSILGNGDVALILDMAALLNGVEADSTAAAA